MRMGCVRACVGGVRWGEMKLGGVGCGDLRDDMGKGDTMWVGWDGKGE